MATEQSPVEAWRKLIENTMQYYPAPQSVASQAKEDEKDPWITLIDQLWKANPYSKLVPLDPAEITRAFQQIWLDAARHPDRALAAYNDFVQQYTQIMAQASLKFWGRDQDAKPVIAPEKGD